MLSREMPSLTIVHGGSEEPTRSVSFHCIANLPGSPVSTQAITRIQTSMGPAVANDHFVFTPAQLGNFSNGTDAFVELAKTLALFGSILGDVVSCTFFVK